MLWAHFDNLLALLAAGWEEGVTEDDVAHARGVRVRHKVGIDVKENRHVHLLARLQSLLLEAETLNLVEMDPGTLRGHVVRRYT